MSGFVRNPDADTGKLSEAPARDWVIRFAFGAAVSALAGVVTKLFGPTVGGLFLAFPAILLASLTLVAKEEGGHRARDDARGAALGALGLVAFAVVVWATTPAWPVGVTLVVATLAWAVVGGIGYLVEEIVRRLRRQPDDAPAG
jgi:uncharacterized membrane protein (GlpM family)